VNEKAVIFECGGESLVGVLHAASAAGDVGVLIVVGGPQYRVGSHRQFVAMARRLAAAGHDVLRFDYRGMGDSDGPFGGFEKCGDDIRAAIDSFLRERPQLRGVVLFGLCDGASAALMYAPKDARVAGLMLANPWVRSESTQAATILRHYYWKRLLDPSFWSKLLKGGLDVRKSIAGLSTNVQNARSTSGGAASFIDRMRESLTSFRGRTLLLLSGDDLTAREFADLFDRDGPWLAARKRAQVVRKDLPEADHTFSQRPALESATNACAEWLKTVGAR